MAKRKAHKKHHVHHAQHVHHRSTRKEFDLNQAVSFPLALTIIVIAAIVLLGPIAMAFK